MRSQIPTPVSALVRMRSQIPMQARSQIPMQVRSRSLLRSTVLVRPRCPPTWPSQQSQRILGSELRGVAP
jgi:hypothetical protein